MERAMKGNIKIFAGNCNRDLAKNICKHVGVKLGECEIIKFSKYSIISFLLIITNFYVISLRISHIPGLTGVCISWEM